MSEDTDGGDDPEATKYGPVDAGTPDGARIHRIGVTDHAISKRYRRTSPQAQANDRAYSVTELRRLVPERRGRLYRRIGTDVYHLLGRTRGSSSSRSTSRPARSWS